MEKEASLKLPDGRTIDFPVLSGTIGPDVVDIRTLYGKAGVFTYDPGFLSTASCRSAITYIDGDKGLLLYRGYPIEQLARHCDFLDVCYLLLNGELPDVRQKQEFDSIVTRHTMVHDQLNRFFTGFRRDAHPMAVLVGVVGALSAFYHDSTDINNPLHRKISAFRLIAKLPTITAMAYKYSTGQPFMYPKNELSYTANLMRMMFGTPAEEYKVNDVLVRALDRILILHADHEQNASTSTVRLAGSSGANPFACIAAGIACLWGPAHGGANEAALQMLDQIGDVSKIGEFIKKAKDKNSGIKLMGFGHRVYKNYDPRAKLMRETCHEVLAELGLGGDRLFKLAMALEKIALEDEYFVSRKLYPNVDFYSGIVQRALGIPVSMFTCIFALARTVGWIAQWNEMLGDTDQKIGRPRQLYEGARQRDVKRSDVKRSSAPPPPPTPPRRPEAGSARADLDAGTAGMMKQLMGHSYLFGGNAPFVEDLYERYLANPGSVPEAWREYFDQMQLVPGAGGNGGKDVAHAPVIESFVQRARSGELAARAAPQLDTAHERLQVAALLLITAYRIAGSRWATLDPLKRLPRPAAPELEPGYYDLTEADLDVSINAGSFVGVERTTLRALIQSLRETYCRNIGFEYMFISDRAQRDWIQQRIEPTRATPSYGAQERKRLMQKLTEAETLERYLHTKYVGQKRFSLEGGESLIPSIDELIHRAGKNGVQEIVIGMAHRGRLNVLVNVLGKMPKELFSEFEGKPAQDLPMGDVKYHNGFSSDLTTEGGPVHVSLAFNPSHLEIVNPVVEGSVRARQRRRDDKTGDQVLPILIHGDAAFAGQGVVMETLNLSGTRGFGTGGTVHLIVNNQIGFTTSDVRDARSTIYCTDIAKMVEAPIFHVNGDDPEAVLLVTQAALDFRQRFHKDVVVDIVCFRKLGHNEQDEPFVTQPLMYKKISQHPGTRKLYADKLVTQGVLAQGEPEEMIRKFRDALDAGKTTSNPVLSNFKSKFAVDWAPFLNTKWTNAADTLVPLPELQRLAQRVTAVPEGFAVHPTVERVLQSRRQMAEGKVPVDWGMAETLAYASLLANGYDVRLSGQDSGRGTFAHRHAVLHDQDRERWDQGTHIPLQHVSPDQGHFTVIDSLLSEEAVVGFEYGYSSAEPNALVIWEAQFGDFANGAQVVIDQFISSGEAKWGRVCGLTMFLPHGHEGQGPEHSSARLERYLQLCAEHNMQVCVPSSAAQVFHLLRRQMLRPFRKPLIVLTPKSLLRKKDASSSIKELAKGTFQSVIPEIDALEPKDVKRVIACSGKVYYDLLAARRERRRDEVAIIRVEQLYPFPHKPFASEMKRYPNAREVVWCQEEPQNQGAWYQSAHYFAENMRDDQKLFFAGRPPSAPPAGGYLTKHQARQKAVVDMALGKYK